METAARAAGDANHGEVAVASRPLDAQRAGRGDVSRPVERDVGAAAPAARAHEMALPDRVAGRAGQLDDAEAPPRRASRRVPDRDDVARVVRGEGGRGGGSLARHDATPALRAIATRELDHGEP